MKKDFSKVLIVLLIITQFMSYFKISSLERRIEQISRKIFYLQDTVDDRINSIYANVDKKLEEQASYIEYIETTFGTPNVESLTIPITYTIIPKEVSNKTVLSLDFNGEKLAMERDGTSFSLTKVEEIFNSGIYPKIIISEDNIIKTEQNDLLNLRNIKNKIFPYSSVRLLGSARSSNQTYKRRGTISWDIKASGELAESIKFTEARLVIKVDGSLIADRYIDINDLDGYEIDEEISLNDGETCVMTIVIKDSWNLEHHYTIDFHVQESGPLREPIFDDEKIYTQNGTLLWPQEAA